MQQFARQALVRCAPYPCLAHLLSPQNRALHLAHAGRKNPLDGLFEDLRNAVDIPGASTGPETDPDRVEGDPIAVAHGFQDMTGTSNPR